MTDSNGARKRNDVDWSRFGLADNVESPKLPDQATKANGEKDQTSNQHVRELFDEEVCLCFCIYFVYRANFDVICSKKLYYI